MHTPPSVNGPDLLDRRGDYGFDASTQGLVPIGAGAAVAAGLAGYQARRGPAWLVGLEALAGLSLLATFGLYVHTTRRGKFGVWAEILPELHLRGDEHVLDLGCGRGAVLAMVAKLLPRGHATGVDLWTSDQSGNRPEATLRNLQLEGVVDRCDVRTGDMLALPFEDATFDLIVSSMAIHNIDERDMRDHSRRFEALDQAVRVLKPGGRLGDHRLLVGRLCTPLAGAWSAARRRTRSRLAFLVRARPGRRPGHRRAPLSQAPRRLTAHAQAASADVARRTSANTTIANASNRLRFMAQGE